MIKLTVFQVFRTRLAELFDKIIHKSNLFDERSDHSVTVETKKNVRNLHLSQFT